MSTPVSAGPTPPPKKIHSHCVCGFFFIMQIIKFIDNDDGISAIAVNKMLLTKDFQQEQNIFLFSPATLYSVLPFHRPLGLVYISNTEMYAASAAPNHFLTAASCQSAVLYDN